MTALDYTPQLRQQMQAVGITSFAQLSRIAGVSKSPIRSLRCGKITRLPLETLLKLASALHLSFADLLATFGQINIVPQNAEIVQEYDRLRSQLQHAQTTALQDFQQASLEILEPWMLQWPTAAHRAQQNPQHPAVQILPLVKPVEKLLKQWGIETIGAVGMQIPYNPQQHQLIEGSIEPGEIAEIRNLGYRQGDRLLHRAKVRSIAAIDSSQNSVK
jgi:transcriptional regulator with XRE-family HTH domain